MHNLFEQIVESINPNSELHNKVLPLAAIVVTPQIKTPNGVKGRFTAGDNIRVVDGELADYVSHNKATHTIKECRGNINRTVLEMVCVNLETNEDEIVKII